MTSRSSRRAFTDPLDDLDNISGSDAEDEALRLEDLTTPSPRPRKKRKFLTIEAAKELIKTFPETMPITPSPKSTRNSQQSQSQSHSQQSTQSLAQSQKSGRADPLNTGDLTKISFESVDYGSRKAKSPPKPPVRSDSDPTSKLKVSEPSIDTSQSRKPADIQQTRMIATDGAKDLPDLDSQATASQDSSVEFLYSSSQGKEPEIHSSPPPPRHIYIPSPVKRAATTGTMHQSLTAVDVTESAPEQAKKSRHAPLKRSKGRREAKDTAPTTSQGPRLFDGLTFFFSPDDEVNKLRKLRIQSAIHHGAIRTHTPSEATHIVCEIDTPYDGLVRWLNKNCPTDLDKTHAVQGTWLENCVAYKTIVDHDQIRFRLRGAPRPITPPAWGKIDMSESQSTREEDPVLTPKQLKRAAAVDRPAADLQTSNHSDELEAIVKDFQSGKDMPLEDEDIEKFVSDDDETDEDTPRENRGFTCMKSNTGHTPDNNPNKRTMEILQQMATYYYRIGDNWRTLAYRKAISQLKRQTVLISSRAQAISIPDIGTRLADKIEEIVTTNRLTRLDHISNDPTDAVLQLFMGIHDVGVVQARKWMEQGFRTLEDLKEHASLTPNQKIGVDHYHDFQQRIPRREVKEHGLIVENALRKTDRGLTGIIGGSYRRRMPDSGDIDIMITHPNADLKQLQQWVFGEVIPYMFKTKFMKCALAVSRSRFRHTPKNSETKDAGGQEVLMDSSGTNFLGASQLAKHLPWRRIDLLLVPNCSLGANLIYFTGNDIFNRSIRLLASRKGMRLNQHGLYKGVMRGPGRTKMNEGTLMEGRSERRIFEILGVPYREPWERRC